jgi:hypothetical protein
MAKKNAPRMKDLESDPSAPSLTPDTRPTEAHVAPPDELRPGQEYKETQDEAYVKLCRERCRYVKRTGGLRKNLHPEDAKKAEQLSKEMGLTVDDPWPKVFIAGYMNKPFVRNTKKWNDDEAKTRA